MPPHPDAAGDHRSGEPGADQAHSDQRAQTRGTGPNAAAVGPGLDRHLHDRRGIRKRIPTIQGAALRHSPSIARKTAGR
jgi:hypothetical protein